MKFPLTSAELNARDQIVMAQPAKNNAWYEKAIETCDAMHAQERARLIKEWKESKTWEFKYENWADACNVVLDMTSRHANRLIAEVGTFNVPVAHQKAETLKKIAKLPTFSAENDEEEKPQVHAGVQPQSGEAKTPCPTCHGTGFIAE